MSFTRYTGYTSPPYSMQFTDDTGAIIPLTGVDPTTDFTFIMENVQTLQFKHGVGTWTITDATNGKASYQWTAGDLATAGTFLIYVTVQLPGEPSPRAFDPDTVVVVLLETGGVALSGTDVNLIEVNGQPVSSANPVPISGPVVTIDGGNVTQGSTTDAAWSGSGAGTQIAILKKLVAELAGTLAITASDGAIASIGTEADATWSGSGSGTVIAILKKIEAVLAVGGAVTVSNFPATQAVSATDGSISTIGAKGDTAVTNPSLSASQIALLKGLITILAGTLTISGSVNVGNFPATQAVSATDGSIASLGAIGDAAWSGSGNGSAIAILKKIEAVLAGTLTISGTVNAAQSGTWNVNNVSGTVSLPTGAATSAKQPALGTAGSASSDVITVQGVASMTPIKTDGSGVTQPVSGTFWQATQPISGTVTANAGTNLNTSLLALESGGNLAAAKSDLDTLAGIVSSNKAAVKSATNDIVDLATLLARFTDPYGTNTAISAATTFGSIPLVSALAANSSATLTNASYQDTFLVQINVASAFNGTISFYGLEPDGSTLQLINAHQRNSAVNGNSTAINTSSALNQVWEGSIAGFKAIYVVCTALTSGSASVQLGLTAANYAHAIINTVAQNLTQVNGSAISLGRTTKSASLPVTMASDQDNINVAVNAALPAGSAVIGSTTIQATSGTALGADQSGTELRVSNYVKTATAGDTALALGQATMANSLPVTMASDQTPKTTSTATKTSVAAAASDTAILSSNSSRKGAKFFNDGTAICYLSEGSGAASTSSYTVQIPANGFYEQPPEPVYTGAYRAIWSAANGNLRVTENS